MLIGTYSYTVDEKGRVPIPSKLRKEMGKKVIIAQGMEEYLYIYPVARFQELIDKLEKISMSSEGVHLKRLILASIMEVELDNQGRMKIPNYLEKFASITREVVILGQGSYLEIWDAKKWNDYKENRKIVDAAERIARLSS